MTLKNKVLSGAKWVMVANIFRQVLGIISLIVYARLLTPDDFGVFAILMIFVGFLGMFTDMGTSAALIHTDNPSSKLLSSVFYFNLGVGIVLFLLLSLLTPLIVSFFNEDQLSVLMPVIALNFIVASFGIVQKTLFEKSMNFRQITLVESVSYLVSVVVGIACAFYGMGVYSLVIQTLTASILLTVLMWIISGWRPLFYFSYQEIKSIWGYTANLSLFNTINYFARNADNFLIGKFISSSALGVYSIAYKIMLYPLQNISHVLIRILFPAFSTIKHDNEKFKHNYKRVLFFIALVSFPIMSGLMATAEVFVDTVFGDKWVNLAFILTVLAPVGLMQSIVTTVGSLYMAKGNTKTMFKIGILNAVVTIVFFIIGLPFGVEGVAVSYLLANIVMLYPNLYVAWRQIDMNVVEGIKEIIPIILISFVMSLGVVFFGEMIEGLIETGIVRLLLLILVGIGIYLGLLSLKYGNLKSLLGELRR